MLVCLALVVAVAAPLMLGLLSHQDLSKSYSSERSSTLFALGDVKHVLNGALTRRMYFDQEVSRVVVALGAGALGSIDRTGELLIFDGKAYVKPSDAGTNYEMETSTRIMTPFCLGLEEGVEPTAIYSFESAEQEGRSLDLIYHMLSKDHGRLFAVFGIAEFREIHRSAIKIAPVYNESIIDSRNAGRYFHSLQPLTERVGIFFGLVNNHAKEPTASYDLAVEERMFYVNPADKGSSELRSHTHILIGTSESTQFKLLATQEDLLRSSRGLSVVDVYHLLTQSALEKGVIIVYDVNSVVSTVKTDSSERKAPHLSPMVRLLRAPLSAHPAAKEPEQGIAFQLENRHRAFDISETQQCYPERYVLLRRSPSV